MDCVYKAPMWPAAIQGTGHPTGSNLGFRVMPKDPTTHQEGGGFEPFVFGKPPLPSEQQCSHSLHGFRLMAMNLCLYPDKKQQWWLRLTNYFKQDKFDRAQVISVLVKGCDCPEGINFTFTALKNQQV